MPRITKTKSRRAGSWVELFAIGHDSIRLPVDQVPSGIRTGADLADADWEQLAQQSRYSLLVDSALKMLGRRDHFEAELRHKLRQREREPAIVDRVIAYCYERQYLDDDRALVQAIERLSSRGPVGAARIRADLYKLGCPAGMIPAGLELFRSQTDPDAEVRRALDLKQRHFDSKLKELQRKAERAEEGSAAGSRGVRHKLMAAVYSYLLGRGFAPALCSRAASQMVEVLLDQE